MARALCFLPLAALPTMTGEAQSMFDMREIGCRNAKGRVVVAAGRMHYAHDRCDSPMYSTLGTLMLAEAGAMNLGAGLLQVCRLPPRILFILSATSRLSVFPGSILQAIALNLLAYCYETDGQASTAVTVISQRAGFFFSLSRRSHPSFSSSDPSYDILFIRPVSHEYVEIH